MKDFRQGVRYYTSGHAEISIAFPEDDVCCQHCWMSYRDGMDRYMCRWLNTEIYRPRAGILVECPLRFEHEDGPNLDDLI